MTLAAGKTCFIDMGHHTLFGHVLSALKGELGARMTTVRLRRSRLDTAMSYAIKRKKDGPCGSRCVVMIEHLSAFYLTLVTEDLRQYCPCPDEQRTCLPVNMALWRKLTVFMKFLWMVDEIEVRQCR
jgi:hypothetical protein